MNINKTSSACLNLLLMQLCLKLTKAFSLEESSKNPVVKLFLQNAAQFLKTFDILTSSDLKNLSLINKNLQYFKTVECDREVKFFFEEKTEFIPKLPQNFDQSSSLTQNEHENIEPQPTFKNENDYQDLTTLSIKILKETQTLMRYFQKESFFVKQEDLKLLPKEQGLVKQDSNSPSLKFNSIHSLSIDNQQIPDVKLINQNISDPFSFIQEAPLSDNPPIGVVGFYEHQKNLEAKKRKNKKKKNFHYASSLEYLDEKVDDEKSRF